MTQEAAELRMVLADIIPDAVLHPEIPALEMVRRETLDRARFMLDAGDVAAAAARKRERARA